jgi:hypothetical protein
MSTVKILQGMNAIDSAIATAGSAEDTFAFCLLNNIDLTCDLIAGEVLQGTENTYLPSSVYSNPQVVNGAVATLPGQTWLDMAMQQLGSVEAVFALTQLNNMSVTCDIVPGTAINYSLTPYSNQVVKIYNDNGYKPASGLDTPGPGLPVLMSGIGYWGINYTFIVQ